MHPLLKVRSHNRSKQGIFLLKCIRVHQYPCIIVLRNTNLSSSSRMSSLSYFYQHSHFEASKQRFSYLVPLCLVFLSLDFISDKITSSLSFSLVTLLAFISTQLSSPSLASLPTGISCSALLFFDFEQPASLCMLLPSTPLLSFVPSLHLSLDFENSVFFPHTHEHLHGDFSGCLSTSLSCNNHILTFSPYFDTSLSLKLKLLFTFLNSHIHKSYRFCTFSFILTLNTSLSLKLKLLFTFLNSHIHKSYRFCTFSFILALNKLYHDVAFISLLNAQCVLYISSSIIDVFIS